MGYIFWLVLTFIFSILEIFIPALITIWFAISAALTVIVAFLFQNIEIEVFFFVMLSIILLLFTRPYSKKFFLKNNKENYDSSMIGMEVIITKKDEKSIKNEKLYTVKFKGVEWSAISKDDFEIDDKAYIEKFKGNKIFIKK